MSALKESARKEECGGSLLDISKDLMSDQTFSDGGSVLEASMQCPRENMTPNSDQADLLTHVRFIESICADGPAKAAYVNGSASPHISDEILLDISKNVPGFLPKSFQAQNSTVATSVQFQECDPLRKDGEMTIRQMLTAEDVENRGIWGFDEESPENTLDRYEDGNDVSWNPHKEFMKFLLDDQGRSETEEKVPTTPPVVSQRRRKRKMDMVVMIDPFEESYQELSLDLGDDHLGEGSQIDLNSHNTQYANGIAAGILPTDSSSDDEFLSSNSIKSGSQKHVKTTYNPNQKPFICKDCAQCFSDHRLLLSHITIHKKKRQKVKETNGPQDEGKDANLQCPQCTFGTNCPNTFVQHAKTHEKEKRYYRCQKCPFEAMNEYELKGHMLCEHRMTNAQYLTMGKREIQERKSAASHHNVATSFSCKKCCFQTRNKNILKNHFEILHRQDFKEDLKEDVHFTLSYESTEKTVQVSSNAEVCRLPRVDSQSLERGKRALSSKKRSKSNVPSLIQTDKTKRKYRTSSKPRVKNGSRLDKLHLFEKKHSQKRILETNTNQKTDQKKFTSKSLEVAKRHSDKSLNSETTVSEKEGPKSLAKFKGNHFTLKERSVSRKSEGKSSTCHGVGNKDASSPEEKSSAKYKHLTVVKPLKKSPSKRKMSTPFHNMQGQDILIDFPKCRQNLKKKDSSGKYIKIEKDEDVIDESTLDSTEKCDIQDEFYIGSQFSHKHSSPAKGSPHSSSRHSDQDLPFSNKERHLDRAAFDEAVKTETDSDVEEDLKSCPYCPAEFESGIGLSNHIRGHIHRVASSKKVPQAHRRMAAVPQAETAEEDVPQADLPPKKQSHLTCPLCRAWFFSGIGLSNHVRGHLKRLGKPASANESAVKVLNELMRDKKLLNKKLQALEKKCRATKKKFPFRISNGLVYSTVKVQRFAHAGKRHRKTSSQSGDEKKRTEVKDSPSRELIGILKKRRAHEEAKTKSSFQTARKTLAVSPIKERGQEVHHCKMLTNSISEKNEHRKVCGHCNVTFHSGVSLANHLRAYARKKRNTLTEGAAYDCKQRKQRSRSGSKKKCNPLLHSSEEIYRLTCRFCDLVFQGPLSVQEDWVKHLQRHIMNTSVPHTGAGMVEVTCFPKDPCSDTPPQTRPNS